ncbi:MAG: hypothetical protein KDJ36_04235 [Hyphomicrobiaceae bacterium]|nr:hypothetical protein [Hyphomicrobiaceae bacterium]
MLKSNSRHALKCASLAALAIAGASTFTSGASAAIRCDGAYQLVPGNRPVSTPFCRDRYLARVARRSYGVSTSFAAIRNSIEEKERVCRMIGHDWRVNDICIDFQSGRSGPNVR